MIEINSETGIAKLTATLVPDADRIKALPRHFGIGSMLKVESAVYGAMRMLARSYGGGFWRYYELSNQGFYMAPDIEEPFFIAVDGNGFEGSLSADGAGIVASLFGINRIAQIGCRRCIEHFYLLRDYAFEHAECRDIVRAID